MIRRVGFFRELKHGDSDGASLSASCSDISIEDEDKIINYLQSGTMVISYPGVVSDVLGDVEKTIGPAHILSDGIWVWPMDLSYYVSNYHVALPKEFIEYMRIRNWKCKNLTDKEIMKVINCLR